MRHPDILRLFSYWNNLRQSRAAPDRAAIDPAAISFALGDCFILQTDGDAPFTMRLAGMRLSAWQMRELKGTSFLDLWGGDGANMRAILHTVMDGACPVVAGAQAAAEGRAPIEFEALFLPLRHFGKTHARILGAFCAHSIPDWIGLTPVGQFSLTSLRILPAGGAVRAPVQPTLVGAPRALRPSQQRPHLIVHDGGLSQRAFSAE
jgi:hypothetical protein